MRNSNQLQLANILREYEASGIIFSTDMVAERTNYTKNSINKYFNEKLIGKYIFQSGGRNKFRCEGIVELSNEQFLSVLSQSSNVKYLTPEDRL